MGQKLKLCLYIIRQVVLHLKTGIHLLNYLLADYDFAQHDECKF